MMIMMMMKEAQVCISRVEGGSRKWVGRKKGSFFLLLVPMYVCVYHEAPQAKEWLVFLMPLCFALLLSCSRQDEGLG